MSIHQFRPREDDSAGLCPVCHRADDQGVVIEGNHYAVCRKHKRFWCFYAACPRGANDDQAASDANKALLLTYRRVDEPYHYPRVQS